MKTQRDNRIVVDLKKVQYARFYYENQDGTMRNTLPIGGSYNNQNVHGLANTLAHHLEEFPDETLLERYERRGIPMDVWTPTLRLKVTANCCLIYTGDKATALWKKWGEMIFKDNK